jgi:general secretion pathway protein C
MTMRLLSFVIWAVVAASAVFWLTRLLSRSDPAPSHTVTASAGASVASADLSRLLGSTRTASAEASAEPEPEADARFKLIGVVAPKSASPDSGLALIAVDGKPPRPVMLGGVVDGPLVLLAVNHRRAELGPAGGEATVRLELPAVPEANRSKPAPRPAAPVYTPPPQVPGARQQTTPPPPQPAVPGRVPGQMGQHVPGQAQGQVPGQMPRPGATPAPQAQPVTATPNRPIPAVQR